MDYAEHFILPAEEASFNLVVFYGKDAVWTEVINACRRYPMFAEKQVVLLKEAQQMKDIEKLEAYIDQPLSSTIFIVGHKEKKLDGRSSMAKTLKKKGEVLTTRKLFDNQLPEWTSQLIHTKGFLL
jgi:DNA polymerase III subunit delta